MAKRAPANQTPYSPLDADLARSVMDGVSNADDDKASAGAPAVKGVDKVRKPKSPRVEVIERSAITGPVEVVTQAKKRLSREKRVMLSGEEEREIERLVDRLAEVLGTSLKLSHLLRACMTLLCHAEGELHTAASILGPFIRPANGNAIALAQFESDLARLLSKAMRDAPPIR